MEDFVVDDLRFAQAARLEVEIALLDGEKIQTGVHEVNSDEGFVSTYAPQAMGISLPPERCRWI
jgi:hypothetical protein